MERRGDAKPRNGCIASVRADARAGRGDEGRSGLRTRRAITVNTSTSTGSGHGRSRSRSRIHRSLSAATGPACSTASWRSAMNGCRTGSADDDAMIERFGQLAERAREAGRDPIPITMAGMMRDPARIERFERAGVHRSIFWLPSRGPGRNRGCDGSLRRRGAGVRRRGRLSEGAERAAQIRR